jgi:PAS domain S-box-containing protein
MRGQTAQKKDSSPIVRYALLLAVVWTVVVAASAAWNIVRMKERTSEMVLIEARNSLTKDIAYRRWNAMQGAVYVPSTMNAPPNPYLKVLERDVVTRDGRHLTMVNPAYMTRQVHELMQKDSGVLGHITSLNVIRPENKPDDWESKALQAFNKGKKEFNSLEVMNGKLYMRYMEPLMTEKQCLGCHASQGYREGDIRGGISVSIPMEPLKAVERGDVALIALAHGLIWLFGLGVLAVGSAQVIVTEKERKRAEEELQSSERRFRGIFENAVEGMFQVAPEGYFINANPALASIHGYDSPEEMVESITDAGRQLYVNPEERTRYRNILEKEGKIENFEVQLRKKDGAVIWASLNARAVKDTTGKVLYFEGIVQDITAHKEAEEALLRYSKEAADLYNNAPCGYHSLGPDGTYVNVNETELAWLGYSRDEIVGKKKFSDLITADSLSAFRINFETFQKQGWARDLEYTMVRKDGTTFPVLLNTTLIRDEGGSPIMSRATIFDITELKRAEKELHRFNETLEQRVEARTEEMRQARRVALSMMQDAEKEKERVREALEKLHGSEEALREAGKEQAAIFESLSIGIAFIKDRTILRGNEKLGELFGRTMDEMIGQPTRIWYKNEEEYLGIGARPYEDLKRHAIHRREQELMRKDGSLFWCLFNVRAIDAQDISHGIVCTLEDITERKKAEKELAERMEELERFSRLTIDREERMIELKGEINTLLEQLGKEKKYRIVE